MRVKHRLKTPNLDCSARTVCPVMTVRRALLFCALLFTPQAFSADISGIWKHAKAPVWIEVSVEEGSATVARNERSPDRVGRTLLKDLEADESQQGLWRGVIYVEKLAEYRDVEVTLPEAERMLITGKAGFISRTVEWVRVVKTR